MSIDVIRIIKETITEYLRLQSKDCSSVERQRLVSVYNPIVNEVIIQAILMGYDKSSVAEMKDNVGGLLIDMIITEFADTRASLSKLLKMIFMPSK